MGVHLVFFLHITSGPDSVNNVMALAFGLLIVMLLVFGSLWIMTHLESQHDADGADHADAALTVILRPPSGVGQDTQQPVRRPVNKLPLILLISLAATGAYAQGTGGGITMSTDPARAAAVEKHAQELQARPSTPAPSKSAAGHTSATKTKAKAPTTHKSSASKSASSTSKHAAASTKHPTSTTKHPASTTKHAKAPQS